MPTTLSKPVIYKVSKSSPPTGESLSKLLAQALLKLPSALEKCRPLDDQGAITAIPAPADRSFQILTHITQDAGTVFGKLVQFTGGQHHSTLSLTSNGLAIVEQQVAPGAGQEFVDASLYFLVSGNHVVVAQSLLREQQLNAFMDWLLESTGVHPAGTRLFFEDKPSAAHQAALSNIKSVSIESSIETTKLRKKDGQTRKRSVSNQDKAVRAIKALLGMDPTTNQLPSEILDRGSLTVTLDVMWHTRKPPLPNEFIDGIANVLSGSDLKYTIYPISGGSITADQIKIDSFIQVAATNSVPDPESVRLGMKAFLAILLRQGRV